MSTTTITSIVTGIIIAILWGAAQKNHDEFNAELESKPLPEDALVNTEIVTEEGEQQQLTTEIEDEEVRKAYIIKQKKLRAYEIWALRKKVVPIGLGIVGGSLLLMFLVNYSIIFPILAFLGFIGGTIYLVAQLGSKNYQYSLLIGELKKEGITHSQLKDEFKQWYYIGE